MFKLPILDILHRGVVLSLVGLSAYGIVASFAVHKDTLQRGRGTMCPIVIAFQSLMLTTFLRADGT
ncbi:hypothetical protein BDZ94DRAFT_605378 [Collybia nuda]|uniref:Uncharacterized protein n=1 Tax=Collybia nuda TaxID=64659 RepID=A0A9P5Y7G7_9AGAR|nr:hypothetical protein BDZ94DRAFT_605378 [Collybia nuda]